MLTPFTTKLTKQQIKTLEKKHLNSLEQMLRLCPKAYHDLRTETSYNQVLSLRNTGGQIDNCCLICQPIKCVKGKTKSNKPYWKITFFHPTLNIWICALYFKYACPDIYSTGTDMVKAVLIYGTLTYDASFGYSMAKIQVLSSSPAKYQKIIPEYPEMKRMSNNKLMTLLQEANTASFEEIIPDEVLMHNHLPGINELGLKLHNPACPEDVISAKRRLMLERMLYFSIGVKRKSLPSPGKEPIKITKTDIAESIENGLPFTLTDGQKNVIKKVKEKLLRGDRIDALIQGDVACGKSITAFLLMAMVIENGYQAAIMAPTVILAKQHYNDLVNLMAPFDIQIGFFGGTMTTKEKKELCQKVKDGTIMCIVGTHGLVEDNVEFRNLGMAVIDEEQRFGVEKRETLRTKSSHEIAYISMSATPIPRTLATTVFGENIDVFSIKQMPAGRKPVITSFIKQLSIPKILRDEVLAGRQAYVICPMIEDGKIENVISIQQLSHAYQKAFLPYPNVKIGVLTGRDKKDDYEKTMEDFQKNKIHILIATTVVEVGVNNPNASVIAIYNAERFGLSTLHQLRGRVKRGLHQPYCILISDKEDNPRIYAMLRTQDGFELAQMDLELRKAGDILGTKQSGKNKILEEIIKKPKIYDSVKIIADQMISQGTDRKFMDVIAPLYQGQAGEDK